jgi:hypothetical protein
MQHEVTEVRIEGASFVRDVKSMGLSNINSNEKNDYLAKVRMLTNQKTEINNIRDEISCMKDDMCEIKSLLAQLLGKGTNG